MKMTAHIKTFVLVTTAITWFIACNKEYNNHCFESQGDIRKEVRPLSYFSSIVTWGVFDIYLLQDTIEFAEIECGENLFPYVETIIKNGTLQIYDNVHCEWSRKYFRPKLTIHFKNLNLLKNQEPVHFESIDTLMVDKLWVYARSEIAEINLTVDAKQIKFTGSETTAGKYYLNGKTNYLEVECNNALVLEAYSLETDSAYVDHNSIGNIKLNVTEKLKARVKNDGDILLKSQPKEIIVLENSGNGKVMLR